MIDIVPLADIDPAAVEALLDRAFEPGRKARTAYKVRGDAVAIDALSFAAVDDGALVGSIQCWPIALAGDDGITYPLVMLGPVAVEPDRQDEGIGRLLVEASLAAADAGCGGEAVMLIGDPEYYGRFFGFTANATGGWRLPGPFEARRLLARGNAVPAGSGLLSTRRLVDA